MQNCYKIIFLVTLFWGLSSVVNPSAFAYSTSEIDQCLKQSTHKTEIKIHKLMKKMTSFLKSKTSKVISPISANENIQMVTNTGKTIAKSTLEQGSRSKMLFYKYIRKHGIKLKLKIPIDGDLIQNEIIDKLITDGRFKPDLSFNAEYSIEIDPDLKTGHIFRNDSLIFTPRITFSNLLKLFNTTGILSNSFIYTLTRKHLGHKSNQKFKSDDEYIEPIRKVLRARPVFFKKRCYQSRLGYFANLKGNINLPSSYNELKDFMIAEDTLTYQKKSIISIGGGQNKFKSIAQLLSGVERARSVSLNKIIHKTTTASSPFPIYHVKTFLDYVDTNLSLNAGLNIGAFNSNFVDWKPLDKILKKPLKHQILSQSLKQNDQLTFMNSFFLAFEEPVYRFIPNEMKDLKSTYNQLLSDYFLPHWSDSLNIISFITDFKDHDERKEYLSEKLIEIIRPLDQSAAAAKEAIDNLNLPTRTVDDPTCNKLKLYPFTKYFSATKDLKESILSHYIGVPKLIGYRYTQKGKDNFYKFASDVDNDGDGIYDNIFYSQAVLNQNPRIHFLLTKQNKHRQTYLLAEAGANKHIKKFKTLGFNYELSDTYFSKRNSKGFKKEIFKIVPSGQLNTNIRTQYNKAYKFIKKKSAYLGYKYLFTQKGFKKLTDKVNSQASSGNLKYIQSLLESCILEKDPNYDNKTPCTSHMGQYYDYIKYKNGYSTTLKDQGSAGNRIHIRFSDMDSAIKAIATKLTLILLDNSRFYETIDLMPDYVKRMVYKVKSHKLTTVKRFKTINNAKYAMFKSIAGIQLAGGKLRTVDGEEEVFKEIAPIFLTYLLYYSLDGSDHQSKTLYLGNLHEHMYFYAIFRAPEVNEEWPVRQKLMINNDKFTYVQLDDNTKNIIRKINFFEFHFNSSIKNKLTCDDSDSQSDDIRFVQ